MTKMEDRRKAAWIIGAGSGMGRASAITLAATGWRLILSGRRPDALNETLAMVTAAGGEGVVMPFDISSGDPTQATSDAAAEWGGLDGMVVAAGLNAPLRMWSDQRSSDLEAIVETNLVGPIRTLSAALPSLRLTGGVIVVISSYSGWTYHPSAGVAYGATKTALGSVVRSLNSQEAGDGVRACHLCPGDVDSDFLRMRPQPPGAAARAAMLSPADIGRAVEWIMNAPQHVRIDELVISPVSQLTGL